MTPVRRADGVIVGYLKGNVYFRKASRSKHLFRSIGENGSWGMDYDILYDLPEKGVARILDKDTGTIYQTTIKKWKELGSEKILHFKDSVDHNTQVFLPLEHFIQIHGRK